MKRILRKLIHILNKHETECTFIILITFHPDGKSQRMERQITAIVSPTLLDIYGFGSGRIAGERVFKLEASRSLHTVIADKTVYRGLR